MKSNRFAFLYKYILLALLLCAVISFAVVFARYSTSSSSDATLSVSGFDVSWDLYYENADETDETNRWTHVDDTDIDFFVFEYDTDSYSFKVDVKNSSDFSICCEIETNSYFVPSFDGQDDEERCSSSGDVLVYSPIESGESAEIYFSVRPSDEGFHDTHVVWRLFSLTVRCAQASE